MKSRLQRWESASGVPLTIAASAFFVAFALPIIWYPGMPASVAALCAAVQWVTWAAFVADFVVRLCLARQRWRFLGTHWLDLFVIALPMLRPLQLVPFLYAVNRRASARLRGRVMLYVSVGALMMAVIGSLAVLQAERASDDASITTVGTALWWVFETMTTVGYGDVYPVTGLGRFIAVVLMIAGVAVISSVTAGLASWITEPVTETAPTGSGGGPASDTLPGEVAEELRSLRAELAELRATLAGGESATPDACEAPASPQG